jgi:arabinogalactan oligomer/maltooligosaccharide transport system permease protein
MKGYFDTVPKDLEEAALIDGCTPTGAFWRIILPLAAPAVAVTALFAFMTGWTEIVLAWTMLENPKTFTLAMALYSMVGQYSTTKPWSEFAAMSILISLPVVFMMLFLQRYIVSGLTSGAVKG